jgi:hypothetical protein
MNATQPVDLAVQSFRGQHAGGFRCPQPTLIDLCRDKQASELRALAASYNPPPTQWTALQTDTATGIYFATREGSFAAFEKCRTIIFEDKDPRAVIDVAAGFKLSFLNSEAQSQKRSNAPAQSIAV